MPPNAQRLYSVSYALTLSGTVASFDAAAQDDFRQQMAAFAGVDEDKVELSVASGSIVVTSTITFDDAGALVG